MADSDYRLGFDTSLDPSGLKEGLDKALSHAESEVMRSAAKQTAAVQKAADEQIEIHRRAAKEETAERKKYLKEQIAAIRSRPDLTQEAKQSEIEAVKEAEQVKIDAVKARLKQQIAAERTAANESIQSIRKRKEIAEETENSAERQAAAVTEGALKEVEAVKAAADAKIEERKKSTEEQIELIRAMPDLTNAEKRRRIKAAKEAGAEEVAALEGNLRKRLSLIQESVTDEVNAISEAAELKSRTDAAYEAARKEVETRRRAVNEQTEEIKRLTGEEIAAIRERTDLAEAEKQKQIDAATEAAGKETEAVKAGLEEQIAEIRASAEARVNIIRESSRRQRRELENGNRDKLRSIRDFSEGASQSLGGFMKTVTKALKSPVALGAAAVLAGRQVLRFLGSTAEAWRREEQAQIALAAAARNNPYLNDRGVHQLRQFAGEMQRLTGIDNVQVMAAQTRLASLGRNQQEIERIVRTAADIAATGLMSYDQAVDELSNSFSGFTRRLERMFPELKNLTEEALAAGDAINVVAASVSGMAEQAMQTGTGSVQAFGNAMESLRRSIGQDWERILQGPRDALTEFINSLVRSRERTREFRAAASELVRAHVQGVDDMRAAELRFAEARLYRYRTRAEAYLRMAGISEEEARQSTQSWRVQMIERIDYYEEFVENLRNELDLPNQVLAALEKARAAADRAQDNAATLGTEQSMEAAARAAEAYAQAVIRAQQAIDYINRGQIADARSVMEGRLAEQAQIAESEAEYTDRLIEQVRIREENLEKLYEEIRQIKLRAEIEGRSLESAEVQQQILNARIGAFQTLVTEIGNYAEQEQQTMRELQNEFLRQQIAAGNRLLDENMRHLETRRRDIVRIAEMEERIAEVNGQRVYSDETRAELLDAQVNAYQNQLRILRDLIDNSEALGETERRRLENEWERYARQKINARTQRRNLEDTIRLQQELRTGAERMYESARVTIDDHQFRTELDRLETLRLDAARRGAEEEREIIRDIYNFKAARGKDAIRAELEFLGRELEHAGKMLGATSDPVRKDAIRAEIDSLESMIAALGMSNEIANIEKADRLFERMLETVSGPNAKQRVKEISALRLELLEEEIRQRQILGEDAESLAGERARREVAIHQQAADKIREIYRQMIDDMNRGFDKFLDAIRNIANSITTIWTNSIERQTQEKLRANDAMIQSDEKRAAEERRILKRAALERFKAEMFAWSANVTFATAQAGMATLTAFAEALKGTGPAGPAVAAINAALVAATSAAKVATVVSARPNPPRFHKGTMSVPGRSGQEVPSILMAGERVLNAPTIANYDRALINLANMAHRQTVQIPNITVNNNMGREAKVSQNIDPSGISFTIDHVVRDGIAKGKYDEAFDRRDARKQGRGGGTF